MNAVLLCLEGRECVTNAAGNEKGVSLGIKAKQSPWGPWQGESGLILLK